MDNNSELKYLTFLVKIVAAIVAVMILLRFAYVLYDFILNPFHKPAILSEEAVKHVMTALILLELLALTLQFIIREVIDPNLIIIAVLTALGRELMVLNIKEVHYANLIASGFIFAVLISGLYILKKGS